MLVGVIGKSGAGKTYLVEKFKQFDNSIIHIDIDKIWAEIIQNKDVIDGVVKIVDDTSIVKDGKLDRYKTGDIIFKDKNKYLPISPKRFEQAFNLFGIDIKLQYNCSWENTLNI